MIVSNIQTTGYQSLWIRKHAGLINQTVLMSLEREREFTAEDTLSKSLPTEVSGFTNWIISESQSHQTD